MKETPSFDLMDAWVQKLSEWTNSAEVVHRLFTWQLTVKTIDLISTVSLE